MEHPCYKCGASVEEGVPFCPQCNAPQIRVVGAEGAPSVEPSPQSPHYPSLGSYSVSLKSTRVDWPQAVRCAIISGSLSAMVMVVPIVAVLGMLAGGGFCIVLYRWRTGRRNLTPGVGMQIGAMNGVVASLLLGILTAVGMVSTSNRAELQTQVVDIFQQQAALRPSPGADMFIRWIKTPDGFVLAMILSMIVFLIFAVLLSGTGGAIGAALLRKKDGP